MKKSKAYRFEDDIRFQLQGEATKEDSVVIQKIISDLKELIEIVDVKLVSEDGNFVFTFHPSESGTSRNWNFNFLKGKI